MQGLRFNGPRARGEFRFGIIEMLRQEVNKLREAGEAHDSMLFVCYGDVRTTAIGMSDLGYADNESFTALIENARQEVVKVRLLGSEPTMGAPDTARVAAVAHVNGARDMATKMVGQPGDQVLAEGAMVNVVYADLNTTDFVIDKETGMVTGYLASSVNIGPGIDYFITHEIDLTEIGLKSENSVGTELGMLLAALTAQRAELAML